MSFDYAAMVRIGDKAVDLQTALTLENYDLVVHLLRTSGEDCRALMERSNMQGQTFLHGAVREGDLSAVKALVEGSGIVDVVAGGTTPAHVAAITENGLEILKFLASKGADLNARSAQTTYSMLMDAIWRKQSAQALFLIDSGADFSTAVTSKSGWSVVDFAASGVLAEVYFKLAEKGALAPGDTALALALRHHGYAMVEACLAHPEYRRPLFEEGWERLLEVCVFGNLRERLMAERTAMDVLAALQDANGEGELVRPPGRSTGLSL
jgi:ankyrin repeat protein